MAFTLRGTQSSLWQPQGARRPRVSAPRLATNLCLVSGRLPSVRCSAQGGDASAQGVRLKSTPSQSWMHRDSSFADTYAGWSLVESDATDDFSRGLLKIGMGIALGVGFALASYSIYSRKGFSGTKDGLAFVPVVFQRQQGLSISFADSAGPEETSTTTPKLNVDTQGPVEASESITEEVTDLHQPNNSASKVKLGRVLVPAVVDQLQEQALAAMHGLKVIEAHTEAGNICTRREYARWLIAASHTLARSSAHKVFPAMYIENVSELAFDDVLPEDPDFPFIQGLAEAGLISSRLSDLNEENIENRVLFLPDSPLSRQDLVSWKVALEQHNIPKIDNESLQTVSGFIDLEKIHKDALPALAVDVSAGERSITAMAFGYTRRFQPDKPVTIAQAAVALTSGEAGEHVAEELARLEAETLAEAAVSTEIAMEARAKKEANAAYIEELEEERKCTAAAQSLVGALRLELEAFKTEREEEKFAILKDRAAIESEKEFVSHIRIDIERLSQELSNEKVKVAFDREKLEKLVAEAEREKLSITTVRSELEVEKKALTLARRWAEDEAKQARAHAKILEEARKRWENQGIEVHVDQELDDNNIPSTIWTYDHEKVLSESSLQKSHNLNIAATAEEIKRKCKEILDKLLEVSGKKFIESRQETHEALQEIWKKALEIQQATYSIATEKSHELNEKTNELQKAAISAVAGLSAQVVEGTKKLADGCKGGAEKLVERFKT
ncbi:hypothetical protein O6H91_09G052800 [Diphasiastrum complanatum]|uniref:Uncharacterized protein n=2 Tax=Diphasiastrum complanatum TaxID=34168 RepID=A0ACC2CP51_DIPCM|nr:hypothetical protein O6H91_09G052800 [Diphasiastrum complanatum]KAJ7543795.1 hypothetical protein O6H91_09G052800 [Diphasiastrum complanatum]